MPRASTTCTPCNVRLPAALGVWLPVADGEPPPWKIAKMLAAAYPEIDPGQLPFVALLTDDDVAVFEYELRDRGLLRPDLTDTA